MDDMAIPHRPAPKVDPAVLPEWLLEEDDDFLVFDKPGWLVCHPSKDGPWSSLVGAVREWRGLETLHLVSRLDRETSGIILIAKNAKAASLSQTAMERRWVTKTYYALVHGELKEPVQVDQPLGPDETSKVAVKSAVRTGPGTLAAATFFEPLLSSQGFSLLRVQPHTGRKHQIRIHAQWLGYPIVGDKLYGGDDSLYLEFVEHGWTERLAKQCALERQALHANQLEFKAPHFQRTFRAPLALDMSQFIVQRMGFSEDVLQKSLAMSEGRGINH
jgi:23S rRNA pseudouridine1911/1915/1917 synthase